MCVAVCVAVCMPGIALARRLPMVCACEILAALWSCGAVELRCCELR